MKGWKVPYKVTIINNHDNNNRNTSFLKCQKTMHKKCTKKTEHKLKIFKTSMNIEHT